MYLSPFTQKIKQMNKYRKARILDQQSFEEVSTICSEFFFLDARGDFLYSPPHKKQGLINSTNLP